MIAVYRFISYNLRDLYPSQNQITDMGHGMSSQEFKTRSSKCSIDKSISETNLSSENEAVWKSMISYRTPQTDLEQLCMLENKRITCRSIDIKTIG